MSRRKHGTQDSFHLSNTVSPKHLTVTFLMNNKKYIKLQLRAVTLNSNSVKSFLFSKSGHFLAKIFAHHMLHCYIFEITKIINHSQKELRYLFFCRYVTVIRKGKILRIVKGRVHHNFWIARKYYRTKTIPWNQVFA